MLLVIDIFYYLNTKFIWPVSYLFGINNLIIFWMCSSVISFGYINCFLFIIKNKFVFRFLLPASLIVINDIAAYFFGFFFGRTPLIKLSPKKTWEGFIGASITTIFSAFAVRMACLILHFWFFFTLIFYC